MTPLPPPGGIATPSLGFRDVNKNNGTNSVMYRRLSETRNGNHSASVTNLFTDITKTQSKESAVPSGNPLETTQTVYVRRGSGAVEKATLVRRGSDTNILMDQNGVPLAPKPPQGEITRQKIGDEHKTFVSDASGQCVGCIDEAQCEYFINDKEGKKKAKEAGILSDERVEKLNGMSDILLRGLLKEMGERLLEKSREYIHKTKEKGLLEANEAYAYFGLRKTGCTVDKVKTAYKKLAKKMHPDKNGGTEEAKEAFQQMKSVYEQLLEEMGAGTSSKEKRRPDSSDDQGSSGTTRDNEDDERGSSNKEDDSSAQEEKDKESSQGSKRKEAYDEDSPKTTAKQRQKSGAAPNSNNSIKYNPHSRGSMDEAFTRMVSEIRNLRELLVPLNRSLEVLRARNIDPDQKALGN